MFNNKNRRYTPKDRLISIQPAILAGIITIIAATITGIIKLPQGDTLGKFFLIAFGIFGNLYLAGIYFLFDSITAHKSLFEWINATITGLSIGGLALILPHEMDLMLSTLIVGAAILSTVISDRSPSYFIIISANAIIIYVHRAALENAYVWAEHLALFILDILVIETIHQLKNISQQQIGKLEIINEFSKQLVSTLDTKQILALFNATFQNAIEADSYYIGIVEGDEIHLEVFYDDEEYFYDVRLKRKGTLSNWVITHQKELFLPDLRKDHGLDGVNVTLIGKDKASLSWMGVPIRGQHLDGVMAIASYRVNAFNRSDLELLSNIAQRAGQALDNTYHHALVEEQARLDSLTKVLNHGHFIKTLNSQAAACLTENQPLSLIMLDIDFFKHYNDVYGHQVGDDVLVKLCEVIRAHIKSTDAVGRWGGEEFTISLPNTNREQASLVAERIRITMASIELKDKNQITIPSPTISQGIADYPEETNDITKLIDIADYRLYKAKERGRDQVESAAAFWKNTKTEKSTSTHQ
ncbi:MAG: GGDEF domain-containing protein [Chloroflexi bacterium]|nr:GGDEF domain-containing protein [Chloroflexota bacterium]